ATGILFLAQSHAHAATLEHPDWNNSQLRDALAKADTVVVRARGGSPAKWVHRWLEIHPKEARWAARDLATDPDTSGNDPNSVRWGEGSLSAAGADWAALSEKLVASRFTALPREAPVPHGTVVIEVVIRTGETSAAWAWEY